MLLQPYRALKSQLSDIEGIKLIDWFNDQYDGTIHTAPALFVEFPVPLQFETVSKSMQQAALVIRIHVASKAIMKQDNSINEDSIESHEVICNAVYEKLQGFYYGINDAMLFNSLTRTVYEHHQYLKGWMITTQDFDCTLYHYNKKLGQTAKPDVKIIIE